MQVSLITDQPQLCQLLLTCQIKKVAACRWPDLVLMLVCHLEPSDLILDIGYI